MIQNALFRQCLAAIPEEQKAEFELSFGIAERISEVLKAKNLTQKDFAQKLHKRESEISKWLTGRHNFTMQTIAKIETALGCKLINIAKWDLQTKGKDLTYLDMLSNFLTRWHTRASGLPSSRESSGTGSSTLKSEPMYLSVRLVAHGQVLKWTPKVGRIHFKPVPNDS